MFDKLSDTELLTLKREFNLAYYHLKQMRDVAKVMVVESWVPRFVKTAQRAIIKRNQGIMEEIHDLMQEM